MVLLICLYSFAVLGFSRNKMKWIGCEISPKSSVCGSWRTIHAKWRISLRRARWSSSKSTTIAGCFIWTKRRRYSSVITPRPRWKITTTRRCCRKWCRWRISGAPAGPSTRTWWTRTRQSSTRPGPNRRRSTWNFTPERRAERNRSLRNRQRNDGRCERQIRNLFSHQFLHPTWTSSVRNLKRHHFSNFFVHFSSIFRSECTQGNSGMNHKSPLSNECVWEFGGRSGVELAQTGLCDHGSIVDAVAIVRGVEHGAALFRHSVHHFLKSDVAADSADQKDLVWPTMCHSTLWKKWLDWRKSLKKVQKNG